MKKNMNSLIGTKSHDLFPYNDLTKQQSDNSLLNQTEWKRREEILTSYPRRIVLELTNDCNMHCKMCGRCHDTFQVNTLNIEVIKWLETIFNKVEEVTLMGWGEPTLYPHFLDLICLLDKHPVKKYICTNGTRLRFLQKIMFKYKIDLCAVSINGIKPETNDKIRIGSQINNIFNDIKMIATEKEQRGLKKPFLSFVFCLSKSNRKDLYNLADKAKEIGINRIKIVYLTAFGTEMEKEIVLNYMPEIKEIFQFLIKQCLQYGIELELPYLPGEDPAGGKKHHDCVFPWRDLFIGSDGWVRPCMSTSDRLFPLDIRLPFIKQWNHEQLQNYRKYVNDEIFMQESCKRCYHSSCCNWNMPHAFIQYDQRFSPDWGGSV